MNQEIMFIKECSNFISNNLKDLKTQDLESLLFSIEVELREREVFKYPESKL